MYCGKWAIRLHDEDSMEDLKFSKEMRIALRDEDIDRISNLLSSHLARVNMVTPFGTWLHVASRIGNLDVVKKLVQLGGDVNISAGTFETGPLNTAVSAGHLNVVQYFLSIGAEMDLSEPYRNPLFGAIYNGRLDIVKTLLHHGIDITVRYTGEKMKDMNALGYAQSLERLEIADFLTKWMQEN